MALAFELDVTGGVGTAGQVCGPFGTQSSQFGCYPSYVVMPATCNAACRYANNNTVWLQDFMTSYTKMVELGYGHISTGPGKLGTLTGIDLNSC